MFTILPCFSEEYIYILNEECIVDLYNKAVQFFQDTPVYVVKDPHGLLLRFEIKHPETECESLSEDTTLKIRYIEQFLAKMNNPAIIEVHVNEISKNSCNNLKKWEISTLIANKIEAIILKPRGMIASNKIYSVGFGEFSPPKNTSNNGGKLPNRADIMVLCDINGE